jgi:FkbM family methyltransferase
MRNFFKQLIIKAFNLLKLDLIKLSNSPKHKMLGLINLPINTIIDVGANEGQFTKMISNYFPQARIYCFEPLPEPFKILEKWAESRKGKVILFNVALGDIEGKVEMFSHLDHCFSSSLLKTTEICERLYPLTKKQSSLEVNLTKIDKVFIDLPEGLIPDILVKLDVQGYEDRVIKGGIKTFRKARAFILEVSLDNLYHKQTSFKDIFLLLYDLGFNYIGNLEQSYAHDGHVIFIDAVFMKSI